MQEIRLDKLLSEAGFCSKKRAQEFLRENKVLVNGTRIIESGVRLDLGKDRVIVNGEIFEGVEEKIYYLLNKPKGVVSTVSDEHDRPTVVSLVGETKRIFPVGRLDENTSGLIVLTNDGDFSNTLTHPSFHLPKTYELTIRGFVPKPVVRKIELGVKLTDGITRPSEVKLISRNQKSEIIEVAISEGRNRQIRRMCGALKLELLDLRRVAIGGLRDEKLGLGKFRKLTEAEILILDPRIRKDDN